MQRHHSKIIDCPVKIKSRYHDDNRRYSQRNSRVTDFAFNTEARIPAVRAPIKAAAARGREAKSTRFKTECIVMLQ